MTNTITSEALAAALAPLPKTPEAVVAAIGTKNLSDPAQMQVAITMAQRIVTYGEGARRGELIGQLVPNFIVTNPVRAYDPRLDVGTQASTADRVVTDQDLAARLVAAAQYAQQNNVSLTTVTVDNLLPDARTGASTAASTAAANAFNAINAEASNNCGCRATRGSQRGQGVRT